jgi:hypothetical protein
MADDGEDRTSPLVFGPGACAVNPVEISRGEKCGGLTTGGRMCLIMETSGLIKEVAIRHLPKSSTVRCVVCQMRFCGLLCFRRHDPPCKAHSPPLTKACSSSTANSSAVRIIHGQKPDDTLGSCCERAQSALACVMKLLHDGASCDHGERNLLPLEASLQDALNKIRETRKERQGKPFRAAF